MVNAMFLLTVVPMEERVLEVGIVLLLMRVELVELVCYSYGLLTVVLLYENTPGFIWGYHYVNFSVFTYVSDHFSRFWAHVQYRRSQWLMGALLKHSRLVYCTGDCVLYTAMPHRSYLYIR